MCRLIDPERADERIQGRKNTTKQIDPYEKFFKKYPGMKVSLPFPQI
jgi:hypothetical protein